MSGHTNIFLLFWLPSQAPRPSNVPSDHIVVPMRRNFYSISYPTLCQSIQSVCPGAGEYAVRLTNQLENELSEQIKPYLLCRILFFVMMLVCLLYIILGIVEFPNFISIIWSLVFLVIWMIMTRLVMNSMGYALGDYVSMYKSKLVGMTRATLGAQDVRVDTGAGMAWLEVYREQYQPPAQGYGVPMGIAI